MEWCDLRFSFECLDLTDAAMMFSYLAEQSTRPSVLIHFPQSGTRTWQLALISSNLTDPSTLLLPLVNIMSKVSNPPLLPLVERQPASSTETDEAVAHRASLSLQRHHDVRRMFRSHQPCSIQEHSSS